MKARYCEILEMDKKDHTNYTKKKNYLDIFCVFIKFT